METKEKKNLVVVELRSGSFANGENQKGNFTAYTVSGDPLFVPKRLANSFGILKNEDFKPCFGLVEFGKQQAVTNPETGVVDLVISRDQVKSLYETKRAAIEAKLDAATTELEEQEYLDEKREQLTLAKITRAASLKKKAEEQGLSIEDLTAITNLSVA